MCYMLDIDELGTIVEEIGSKISNPDTQFERINTIFEAHYGIKLPDGIKRASIEKFGDIVSSPLIMERAINLIISKKVIEGETNIIIKNPRSLYRIGILSFVKTIKLDLVVDGNVGNFFGAFCNFDGTWTVKGNSENGLADKGYRGKNNCGGVCYGIGMSK